MDRVGFIGAIARSGGFTAGTVVVACLLGLVPARAADPTGTAQPRERAAAQGSQEVRKPAEQPREGSDWALRLEAATDLPMAVGGGLTLEIPGGLRITAQVGGLPAGYVDVVNELSVSEGWYDGYTAKLMDEALSGSLIWRVGAAWRLVPDYGFYVGVGYQMVRLSADLGAEDLPPGVVGPVPAKARPVRVELASTLHMLALDLGWEIDLASHWLLRLSLGVSLTLGAESEVSARNVPSDYVGWAAKATDLTAGYLDKLYPKVVNVPTLTVALAYRIF